MTTLIKLTLATAFLVAVPFSVYATPQTETPAASEEAPSAMSEGEVRKVDKNAKKITIKHGELKNLDMPPMTMVFQVKDPSLLDQVKTGDKINFIADKIGGQFTVTRIEVKK